MCTKSCLLPYPLLPPQGASSSSAHILTYFHLHGATKRKERKIRFVPEEHQRGKKKRKRRDVFSFLVCFLVFSAVPRGASPESGAPGVSLIVDTGTLGTVSQLPGKTCEELFYQTSPSENPFFPIAFVFIFKTCRW